ncbi:peptide chain release factor 1 [Propylenella binzhouense]|uniref:Peptide chain release factor 1 n=1 Tax=Propylenella binzhouense TaxID=2555902 RepID=A0A964WUQ6_9HYPH|nr:peptide chain release factor 1 [Propylenella binzhouense]MYZ49326.1 peptide chain release factor 1 [Propylenella binzhouense]
MNSLTVSLGVHSPLTPELRDRILETTRARMEEPAYRLLSPEHLRGLARLEARDDPIISVYLCLTPERRAAGGWQSMLSSLAHQTLLKSHEAASETIRRQLDRIETALNEQLPELGRSVVFFVCERLGIWRQITLPIALADRIHVAPRPYIRPLLRSWGEGDRNLVAVLSQERSRFFVDHLGQIEEIYRVKGQRIRGMLTDRVPRDRRDVLATQVLKDEARALAQMAEIITRELEPSYLLVAAPPDMHAAFVESLPKALVERVQEFAVDIHASSHAIGEALGPLREQMRRDQETAVLQELEEAAFEKVAIGVQETLDCLREGRVAALVVDDRFAAPGEQCAECKALFQQAPGDACPICESGKLQSADDLVDAAAQQALDRGARVEFIRYPETQVRLGKFAPMSALLRY